MTTDFLETAVIIHSTDKETEAQTDYSHLLRVTQPGKAQVVNLEGQVLKQG